MCDKYQQHGRWVGFTANRKVRCFGSYKVTVDESTDVLVGSFDICTDHEYVLDPGGM